MANVESVSKCQILEVIRQLASLRYRRAFKKNRDDWDVAPERRRYLDANEVMNVFQASIVLLVACVKPVGANNREQHFALGDCLVERLDEIDAQRDSVDVHEQEFAAELLFQSVVHSSRVTRAAVPAVADEHFGGHRGSSFGDLMDRGAFVPDLDCIPIVNVAYDPTRFEHDPGRGSRRVERVALRDLHPIDKDKKFLAVVVKRLSSPPHICTKSQEKTPHMRCGEVRFQSVSVAAGPESSSASRREAFSPTTGAVMVRVEMDVRPALSVATQLVMVSVAAWSLRQHVQTAASAIVPVPSQGQEAPMRKAIKYLLATAGMFVMVHSAMTVGARAQNIENGVGVVCDSPQQVERVIILRADFKSAVEEINAQNNSRVCEILNVAFLVGGIVAEASNDKGTWQIRKILIVGLYLGRIMNTVQPYQKYTAFLTSKAAPI
jgi:hypothetical protein